MYVFLRIYDENNNQPIILLLCVSSSVTYKQACSLGNNKVRHTRVMDENRRAHSGNTEPYYAR